MSWTIEDRLLLQLCRKAESQKKGRFSLHPQKNAINWERFLLSARKNSVSSLIYAAIREETNHGIDIPKEIVKELRADYYFSAARNTHLFRELGKVLLALQKNGHRIIVLKGAVLAEIVYNNIAMRPMWDIDLLVRKEDIESLDSIFQNIGYLPFDRKADDLDISSLYLTSLDYRNIENSLLSFHVHWHFINSSIPNENIIRNINMERIWQDAVKDKIADVETFVLAPHHLLIHLSEHALRVTHSLGKFSFYCDIHWAINHYKSQLDWNLFIDECRKFKLDRMVYYCLFFTSEFLRTPIPEKILKRLSPQKKSLGEKFFMYSISMNKNISGLSYFIHLASNDGLFRKIKFAGRTLFPPKQIMAQRSYTLSGQVKSSLYVNRVFGAFSRLFKILR